MPTLDELEELRKKKSAYEAGKSIDVNYPTRRAETGLRDLPPNVDRTGKVYINADLPSVSPTIDTSTYERPSAGGKGIAMLEEAARRATTPGHKVAGIKALVAAGQSLADLEERGSQFRAKLPLEERELGIREKTAESTSTYQTKALEAAERATTASESRAAIEAARLEDVLGGGAEDRKSLLAAEEELSKLIGKGGKGSRKYIGVPGVDALQYEWDSTQREKYNAALARVEELRKRVRKSSSSTSIAKRPLPTF